MTISLTIILLALAATFNAFMDLSSEDRLHNWWWNKTTGAMNKWKFGEPALGPKFWGSTTIFVFLTDGWHLFQFLFHTCWQLAIAINYDHWIWTFVIIKTIFSFLFEQVYSYYKEK